MSWYDQWVVTTRHFSVLDEKNGKRTCSMGNHCRESPMFRFVRHQWKKSVVSYRHVLSTQLVAIKSNFHCTQLALLIVHRCPDRLLWWARKPLHAPCLHTERTCEHGGGNEWHWCDWSRAPCRGRHRTNGQIPPLVRQGTQTECSVDGHDIPSEEACPREWEHRAVPSAFLFQREIAYGQNASGGGKAIKRICCAGYTKPAESSTGWWLVPIGCR